MPHAAQSDAGSIEPDAERSAAALRGPGGPHLTSRQVPQAPPYTLDRLCSPQTESRRLLSRLLPQPRPPPPHHPFTRTTGHLQTLWPQRDHSWRLPRPRLPVPPIRQSMQRPRVLTQLLFPPIQPTSREVHWLQWPRVVIDAVVQKTNPRGSSPRAHPAVVVGVVDVDVIPATPVPGLKRGVHQSLPAAAPFPTSPSPAAEPRPLALHRSTLCRRRPQLVGVSAAGEPGERRVAPGPVSATVWLNRYLSTGLLQRPVLRSLAPCRRCRVHRVGVAVAGLSTGMWVDLRSLSAAPLTRGPALGRLMRPVVRSQRLRRRRPAGVVGVAVPAGAASGWAAARPAGNPYPACPLRPAVLPPAPRRRRLARGVGGAVAVGAEAEWAATPVRSVAPLVRGLSQNSPSFSGSSCRACSGCSRTGPSGTRVRRCYLRWWQRQVGETSLITPSARKRLSAAANSRQTREIAASRPPGHRTDAAVRRGNPILITNQPILATPNRETLPTLSQRQRRPTLHNSGRTDDGSTGRRCTSRPRPAVSRGSTGRTAPKR